MNKLVLVILFIIVLLLVSIAINIYLFVSKKNDIKEKQCKPIKMEEQNNTIETEETTNTNTNENSFVYKPIYNYIDEYVEYINNDIVEEYTYYDEEGYKNERKVFEKNYGSDQLTKEEILLKHNTSDNDDLYITFFTKREINEGLRITILADNILLHQNFKIKNGASLLKYKLKKPITKIMFIVMHDDIAKYTEIFRADYKGVLYKNFTVKSFNIINSNYKSNERGIIESGNDYYIDLIKSYIT